MHFFAYMTVLMTAVLSVATPILKRQVGGVLICNGINATGECTHLVAEVGQCTNLTAPYYQNTSTFAPDGEEFYCYPYLFSCGGICKSPEGCTYGAVSYNTTAKTNFTAGGWNNLIESFTCYSGATPEI
ncbi:hypothetical protein M406DRAFT_320071 [Cryphonectria parasitica EP155]|uniref:Uncharacterized protein n=1 Tax=Cryphonectria parasitica (strain ATCC 38755 / EP155) TaxID=660469 RepID=A0A9P4YAA3_CRYP1|nr:uncharacterized protein M406DRAFT_320071 [Cryphonectria parasitica EP155]KAF3769822.1 hypothetical protein M406DRAFT_320071 [Cryphonectria parasitica EP155]